jgi:hypothetical protein
MENIETKNGKYFLKDVRDEVAVLEVDIATKLNPKEAKEQKEETIVEEKGKEKSIEENINVSSSNIRSFYSSTSFDNFDNNHNFIINTDSVNKRNNDDFIIQKKKPVFVQIICFSYYYFIYLFIYLINI